MAPDDTKFKYIRDTSFLDRTDVSRNYNVHDELVGSIMPCDPFPFRLHPSFFCNIYLKGNSIAMKDIHQL